MSGSRTLRVTILGDASGATRAMSETEASAGGLLARFEGLGSGITGLTGKLAALAGGLLAIKGMQELGGAVTGIVGKAADFQSAMSGVGAVAGASKDELAALSQTALKLGQDTTLAGVNASDAARAMEQLASGGVAVKDILGGGAYGALQLASAGGLDVAEAAAIGAAALKNFGLAGADLPHVADLFASAANTSAVTVSDLGVSLKYVGPIAHSMGISLDELTGVFAELGDQGIKAETAGTSLRGMITNLASPTAAASGVMKAYGMSFFDAQGHMKNMAGISEELHTKLAKLTDQQRTDALATLFGNEALSAAVTLYQGGGKAVGDYTAQVNVAGAAAKNGALRNDNLKGSIQALQGAWETLTITLGTLAIPAVRAVVDALTGLVGKAIPLVEAYGPRFVGMIGAAVGALRDFGRYVRAVADDGDYLNDWLTHLPARVQPLVAAFGEHLAPVLAVVRDSFLTVKQALAGDWFGGQTASINVVVRTLGRGVQLARDAVLTFRQALAGQWTNDGNINGFVVAFGRLGNSISSAWQIIKPFVPYLLILGRAITTITSPLLSFARAFVQTGGDVRSALNLMLRHVTDGLAALGYLLGKAGPPLARALWGFLQDAAGQFGEWWQRNDINGKVRAFIGEQLPKLAGGAVDLGKRLWAGLGDLAAAFQTWWAENGMTAKVTERLSRFLGGLGDLGAAIWGGLGDLAAKFGQWWTDNGMNEQVRAKAEELLGKLGDFAGGLWANLGDLAGKFGTWWSDNKIGDQLGTTLGALFSSLGYFGEGVWNGLGDLAGRFQTYWTDNKVGDTIGQLIHDAFMGTAAKSQTALGQGVVGALNGVDPAKVAATGGFLGFLADLTAKVTDWGNTTGRTAMTDALTALFVGQGTDPTDQGGIANTLNAFNTAIDTWAATTGHEHMKTALQKLFEDDGSGTPGMTNFLNTVNSGMETWLNSNGPKFTAWWRDTGGPAFVQAFRDFLTSGPSVEQAGKTVLDWLNAAADWLGPKLVESSHWISMGDWIGKAIYKGLPDWAKHIADATGSAVNGTLPGGGNNGLPPARTTPSGGGGGGGQGFTEMDFNFGGGMGGGVTIASLTFAPVINGMTYADAGQQLADNFLSALQAATNGGRILPATGVTL